MATLLTIFMLCIYSTISIIVIYWLTYVLLGKFKKYASYVVLGGYVVFILVNFFIWLSLYKFIYTSIEKGLIYVPPSWPYWYF